jgi:hypothetical protein
MCRPADPDSWICSLGKLLLAASTRLAECEEHVCTTTAAATKELVPIVVQQVRRGISVHALPSAYWHCVEETEQDSSKHQNAASAARK